MELRRATYVKISNLRPSTGGHNLVAQAIKSVLVVDKMRMDGSGVRVAEVTLADETGAVTLRAKNEQIEVLQPGSVVVVRNAGIEMFKGYMRLVVTKWGKISAYPDGVASTPPAPATLNLKNDVSEVEYAIASAADAAAIEAAAATAEDSTGDASAGSGAAAATVAEAAADSGGDDGT